MPGKKKEYPKEKPGLHQRNKHKERYDFKQLIQSCPELAPFVKLNEYKDESVDFFEPAAVKILNKALLKHFYGVENWDIPPGYLCPPVPGRADYIHHIADLLYSRLSGRTITTQKIKCLDIGVGANCIYPVIGVREYGWSFIGSDIDPVAIESARQVIESNPFLKAKVDLRLQSSPKSFFQGIMGKDEYVDLTICNPPFHASLAEAQAGTTRKIQNLKQGKVSEPILNFGGQYNELWCNGGEERFVRDMIFESRRFSKSCFWFSTLISKQSNLKSVYAALQKVGAIEVKTIPMSQGNKTSRLVCWTFLTPEQQEKWIDIRW